MPPIYRIVSRMMYTELFNIFYILMNGVTAMPKIIVCYKWVVDEQDIRVNQGTQELDFSRTKKKISDYDKNAIEIGTQIWEKNEGSTLVAVSYGDGDVKSSLKDA